MSASRAPLRLFLDAGVPDAVGRCLTENGHLAIYHRQALADGVPDEVVCATAMQNAAILVAVDADMRRLTRQYGRPLASDRFKGLSFLGLSCGEVQAANRLTQALSLLESEWRYCTAKPSRRLWVEIGMNYIRTNR